MIDDHVGEPVSGLPDDGPADRAPLVITRSEEQVLLGTVVRGVGRARVRKVVVTEERTITVQVRREELRVETVTEDGPDVEYTLGSGEPLELVLSEQRPVVTFETVPVERVRIGTRVVTEDESVTVDVAREEIELHHES